MGNPLSATKVALAMAAIFFVAGPALAGPLSGDPAALESISFPIPLVSDSSGLSGTVDSAVYTSAAFQSEFGGSGYTPTPGEFVYAYQVSLDAPSAATPFLAVPIDVNPFAGLAPGGTSADYPPFVDNLGSFALSGGQRPSTEYFALDSFGYGPSYFAHFVFDPSIPGGAVSSGLAFSSQAFITLRSGFVGGPNGYSETAVFAPGFIPEPSTLILAALGGGALLAWRRRLG